MNFLEDIIKEKKDFLEKRKKINIEEGVSDKIDLLLRKSNFKNILSKPGTHLIAEIKRASPSKGDIRLDLDVVDIATTYQKEGVELISVLTEERFFKGSLEDLAKVKKNTKLSILCKDFVIDSFQIKEAKIHGADAILFIAKILQKEQLKEFLTAVKELKMDAVVEVHNQTDLDKVLALGKDVEIIGINNRNLDDFSIDLNTTGRLLPKIPKDKIIIVESGIGSDLEIKQFKKLGANGILIGESIMRENNIAQKIKYFMDALK
jgi:indole-3-glycerol phosphate synthase